MIAQLEPVTLTTNAAGAAQGFTRNRVAGRVVAVKVVAAADVTASFELDIAGEASGSPILVDDSGTENATTWYYPLVAATKAADGDASILSEVPPFVLEERIQIDIAAAGDTKVVVVTVYVDQGR